jgi:hypothetical protein
MFQINDNGATREGDDNQNVHNPEHYTRGGIETIDYLESKLTPEEFLGFCRGNNLKYGSRAGHKDPTKQIEDLKKQKWYIDREIDFRLRIMQGLIEVD